MSGFNIDAEGVVAPVFVVAVDDAVVLVAVDAGDEQAGAAGGDFQGGGGEGGKWARQDGEAHTAVLNAVTL